MDADELEDGWGQVIAVLDSRGHSEHVYYFLLWANGEVTKTKGKDCECPVYIKELDKHYRFWKEKLKRQGITGAPMRAIYKEKREERALNIMSDFYDYLARIRSISTD